MFAYYNNENYKNHIKPALKLFTNCLKYVIILGINVLETNNMKVVVAIDSFKGSITSADASRFVKNGILSIYADAQVDTVTMADGGEGFLTSLGRSMEAIMRTATVTGPLGTKLPVQYGLVPESNTSIIEIAQVVGLNLVPENSRNPMKTSTYGVGELILDALDQGSRNFIIGLGGSATNDGGVGMLQALGYQFVNKKNKLLGLGGNILPEIESIVVTKVDPRLKECKFLVACDVNNPLFGQNGATHVYGAQKGATPEMIKLLDSGLVNLSNIVKRVLGKTAATVPGVGAAGGLGYAFVAFLNGKIESGSKVVGNAVKLEDLIKECDVVVTGEGRIDNQTIHGKAPASVATLAKKYNKLVVAIAGMVENDIESCHSVGIDAIFCVQREPLTLDEAMNTMTVGNNIVATTAQIFRLIKGVSTTIQPDVRDIVVEEVVEEIQEPLDEKMSGDNAIFGKK